MFKSVIKGGILSFMSVQIEGLLEQARNLVQSGNHGEAVNKLTTAANSKPNQSQMSSIEEMIKNVGEHVVKNGNEANGSRSVGGGGLGGSLMSTLMSSSQGSSQAQLGKLALLSTVLGSSGGKHGGFNLGSIASMLGGSGSGNSGAMGSSGLASLAFKFFGGGSEPQNHQQHQTGFGSMVTDFLGVGNNGQQQGGGFPEGEIQGNNRLDSSGFYGEEQQYQGGSFSGHHQSQSSHDGNVNFNFSGNFNPQGQNQYSQGSQEYYSQEQQLYSRNGDNGAGSQEGFGGMVGSFLNSRG